MKNRQRPNTGLFLLIAGLFLLSSGCIAVPPLINVTHKQPERQADERLDRIEQRLDNIERKLDSR